jgi:CRISPR-associated protein Csb2
MRKKHDLEAAARRRLARPIAEVRVGDRFVRWVGADRARRWCQDRELAARVIPARAVAARELPAWEAPAWEAPAPASSACSDWAGDAAALEARPGQAPPRGVLGDDWIVLARVGGPPLPITSVVGLARQLRRALMSFADQPVAEVISGHRSDGAAVETPHLAVVPLPAVTGPRPDGTLLGIALVLPRASDEAARDAVVRALARFEACHGTGGGVGAAGGTDAAPAIPVLLGDAGVLMLRRDLGGDLGSDLGSGLGGVELPAALQPATWLGSARRWTSATPIALDRNPGDLHHADPTRRRDALEAAAACVREAVRRIGLPAPAEVEVLRSSALPGTAEPRRYPRFPVATRRSQRVLVHVRLGFGELVRGPVLVGAGRYHGLGLLLPDHE